MNRREAHNAVPLPNRTFVAVPRVAVGDRVQLTRDVGIRQAGDLATVTGLPAHWGCAVTFDGPNPGTGGFVLRESEFTTTTRRAK